MATISGRLIFDRERTSVASASQTGLANVPIVLQNTVTGALLAVRTDANGNYTFNNVPNGSYQIVEAYGTSATATPGDFTNAVTAPIMNGGTFPPISYAQNPPAGATNLDATTPTTIKINVSGGDINNQNILNGPVTYTPIETITDDNAVISTVNLITKADNGTFGSYPPGTAANTGANPNPYPDIGTEFNYVQPNPYYVQPNDGEYTIQNIMNNAIPNQYFTWWRIADHTEGDETGRMMIVNGYNPGAVFFQQQVTVKPNTFYLFSSWILNLANTTTLVEPQLGVQVLGANGQVLYNGTLGALIPTDTSNPEWKEIGTVLNSQNNTTITVKFTSQGPAATGNDYAIDDIRLHEISFPLYAPVKSADKTQINVGDTVNYTVTLTNPGINPLTGVTIKDVLPDGMTFVPGSVTVNGQANSAANPVVGFTVPDIQGGETVTVVFTARAASVPATNPVGNTATASYNYSPVQGGIPSTYTVTSNEVPVRILSADLSIVKTGSTDPITAGDDLEYRLRVTNSGMDPAESPVITDMIPANLQNVTYSADGGITWNAWSGDVRLPSIAPSTSVDVLVRATVSSAAAGFIQNTAVVTSPTFDPDTSNNSSTAVAPVIESADLAVVKTASPATVTAGGTITYHLVVSNAGPSDATNTVVSDQLPAGLNNAMYSADGGITWNSWTGTYPIANLAAEQSVALEIRADVAPSANTTLTNTVSVTSDIPDTSPNNNNFSVTTPVVAAADLVISKTADKSPAPAGEPLTYTVSAVNNGPSDAANVRITDVAPSLLGNVQYSLDNGATWNPWNGSYTAATLGAQSTLTLLIRGTVADVAGGLINNTASITSDTDDPNPGDNSTTVTTPINTSADLSVTKSVSPQFANHGQQVTFTVSVNNAGPNAASNVAVRDVMPSSLLNGQFSLDNGATWQNITGSLFVLGTVPAGATVPLLLRGTVDQTTVGVVTNSASLSTDTPDPDTSNNSTSINFIIGNAADLSMTKTADRETALAGERLTYTLAIRNGGPDNATNVVLTDVLPTALLTPEFSVDGGTTWQAWSSPYSVGTVPAGTTTAVLIRGTIDPSADTATLTSITNTASVSSDTPDHNADNNTGTVTTPVSASADLTLTKTGSPSPAVAGNMITYNVTVTNNGPSAANDTLLIDSVSANIINPQYSADGGATWQAWSSPLALGTLAGGARQNIQIRGILNSAVVGSVTNTAVIRSTTPDPDTSNNMTTINTPIQPNADISVVKISDADIVNAGTLLTYTMTVSNAGPSYAEDVVLTDAAPGDLGNPEYSTDGGLSWALWTGSLNLGTIASGSTSKVLLRGTVKSGTATTFSNTASVRQTTPDLNPANNTSTATVSLCQSIDLAVTKTADATSVRAGDPITYVIVVRNNSSQSAANVILADEVPAGLGDVVFSADNGTTWSSWSGSLPPFTLAAGETNRILLRATVRDTATGSIINLATVKSDAPDPDPTNNHALAVTPIVTDCPVPPPPADSADLCIEKTSSSSCIKTCEYAQYMLTVKNLGPHTATQVRLKDSLPKELADAEYSDDNGKNWYVWSGTLQLGDMPAGETRTVWISAKVNPCACGSFTNTATVSSETEDPNPSNNRAAVGIHII